MLDRPSTRLRLNPHLVYGMLALVWLPILIAEPSRRTPGIETWLGRLPTLWRRRLIEVFGAAVHIVVIGKGRLLVEILDDVRHVQLAVTPIVGHEKLRNSIRDRITLGTAVTDQNLFGFLHPAAATISRPLEQVRQSARLLVLMEKARGSCGLSPVRRRFYSRHTTRVVARPCKEYNFRWQACQALSP